MIINIRDIHTHTDSPQALVSVEPAEFAPILNHYYSVGLHPWHSADVSPLDIERLQTVCADSRVAAIGECGIDLLRGDVLYKQMLLFRRHIELSESLSKPLIVHCVRAADIIASLRKELKPHQNWVIHGFRGKPQTAEMLLRSGCMLSFGEKFNPQTVKSMPADKILAETDCSTMNIDAVIQALSAAAGCDLTAAIEHNAQACLKL